MLPSPRQRKRRPRCEPAGRRTYWSASRERSPQWHIACVSLSRKARKGESHETAGSQRKNEEGQGEGEGGSRDPLRQQEDGTGGFPPARRGRGPGGARRGAPQSRRRSIESRQRHQEVARPRESGPVGRALESGPFYNSRVPPGRAFRRPAGTAGAWIITGVSVNGLQQENSSPRAFPAEAGAVVRSDFEEEP